MLRLFVEGREVALYPGTAIQLEINNPVFDQDAEIIQGSYSLPFSLPLAPNRITFGFPDLLDNVADVRREFACGIEADGDYLKGSLKLRKIAGGKIESNVTVGISALATALKRNLSSFDYGGWRVMGSSSDEVLSHMNQVVSSPENYPYVFAPYLNKSAVGEQQGEPFNYWVNHYGYRFATSAAGFLPNLDSTDFQQAFNNTSISPMPYLRYVITEAFKEIGVPVVDSFFNEELSKLVILSNNLLDEYISAAGDGWLISATNKFRKKFKIGEVLPDLSLVDLLKKLASSFGLSIQFTLNNSLIIERLSDMISSPEFEDWSQKVSPNLEQEIKEPAGYTLKNLLPTEDKNLAGKVQDIPREKLKEPVATMLQLPFPAEIEEIRLVTEKNQFYQYNNGWEFYSQNYPSVEIGGGGEELSQGHALFLMETVVDTPTDNIRMKVPVIDLPGYSPENGNNEKSEVLRLGFYRGLQPNEAYSGTYQFSYPLVSFDNTNLQGVSLGSYSLGVGGAEGTGENFLRNWLTFRSRSKPVTAKVNLNMVDLANLNMNRKKSINGNLFFVRKISIALPIRTQATVQLEKV